MTRTDKLYLWFIALLPFMVVALVYFNMPNLPM